MNSYKKLAGNSMLFALGNFGSRFISFALVPLYTYYLSTAEYGNVDLVNTTVSMLMPIVSVSIFEAVLRFVMDKEKSSTQVFSNAFVVTSLGVIIAMMTYPILSYFNFLDDLLIYMYVVLAVQAFQVMLGYFVRAIGEVKVYAINGIIQTFATGVFKVLFLVSFGWGMHGFLLAIFFANLVSVLYLSISTKAFKYLELSSVNKELAMRMIIYSLPLIPNSLMWWLINASSRYFVAYFVGVSANGLFAVANKIPTILNLFNQVFSQAWQLSAIEEYDSENKSQFYSEVFGYFASTLFIGTSFIITFLKLAFDIAIAPEYYTAWQAVPFLLIGIVFSSFSNFLGTNYIVSKQTKGVFKTSIIGGIVSLILNIILIPTVGINGAGIASMLSFGTIWIIRYKDTQRFVKMKFNWSFLALNLGLLFAQITILYVGFDFRIEFPLSLFLTIIMLLINKKLVYKLFVFTWKFIKKK